MARFQRSSDAGEEQRATSLELFYDLVFVFAIAGLAHPARGRELDGGGRGRALPPRRVVGVELHDLGHERARPGLGRRLAAPDRDHAREPADGGRDPAGVRRARPPLRRLLRRHPGRPPHVPHVRVGERGHAIERERAGRILAWFVVAGVLWIAGGLAEDSTRTALWLAALAIDYTAPFVTYWIPGRGRLSPTAWEVETSHFAERFQLFVIIALGETVVITGATTSGLELDLARVTAFGLAFLSTAALWWLYFGYVATIAERRLELAEARRTRPGRIHVPARGDRRRHRARGSRRRARDRPPDGAAAARRLAVLVAARRCTCSHVAMRLRMAGSLSVRRLGGALACSRSARRARRAGPRRLRAARRGPRRRDRARAHRGGEARGARRVAARRAGRGLGGRVERAVAGSVDDGGLGRRELDALDTLNQGVARSRSKIWRASSSSGCASSKRPSATSHSPCSRRTTASSNGRSISSKIAAAAASPALAISASPRSVAAVR